MRLSAPKFIVFLLSVVLVAAAVVSKFFFDIPVVDGNEFWFALGGYVLLMLGNMLKGF